MCIRDSRAAEGVDLSAETVFAAAEDLGLGVQLGVDLKADNCFKIVVHLAHISFTAKPPTAVS